MKFCCSNFEEAYFAPDNLAPNIRVVKFTSEYLTRKFDWTFGGQYTEPEPHEIARINAKRNDLCYFLTVGYKESSFELLGRPMMNISYCPFCGTNLYKYYTKDNYANEIEKKTFI